MKGYITAITSTFLLLSASLPGYSAPCAFNSAKNCQQQRDILNDINANGFKYYAPTNLDNRVTGEINIYDAKLVSSYTDASNARGQLKFSTAKISNNLWRSGEIMTRANLTAPPFNAPVKSNAWTTKEAVHGYLEIIAKLPSCDVSADGLCQNHTAPNEYQKGLWPAIWMMPTNDSSWPADGEIDIAEAYAHDSDFKTATSAVHFNGKDPQCLDGDCTGPGFMLSSSIATSPLFQGFHRWGLEWQPDPQSQHGGELLTAYFDNVKVWGPLRTDTLPADGPNAFRRGFSNPNGGYYLIVNLAVGSLYAGNQHPQTSSASMYIQSIKAYTVTN